MSQYTKVFDRFEYHLEDIDCRVCLYYIRKTKKYINGCQEQVCRYADIRVEAIKNGRIKRRRGYIKMRHTQTTPKEKLYHESE